MNARMKETESTDVALLPENALAKPAELFTRERLDEVIGKVRAAVQIVPDLTTEEGRKLIASTAYKVARCKTAIEEVGKELVADWKTKAAEVDKLRKHSRDTFDALRDEVRKPLDEWEAEEARKEQAEVEAARQRREAEEQAERDRLAEVQAENDRRAAELAERERALAEREQAEADRLAKIESDRLQAEREEAIRVEAAAKADRDAAAAIEKAKQDAIDAEARRQREAVAAQQAAHDAEIKAEADKAQAVRETEARIALEQRIANEQREHAEAAQRVEDERRAANTRHRGHVNSKAVAALVNEGLSEEHAKAAVIAIVAGRVPAVSIAY